MGQKLMKAVAASTMATMPRMIAAVPLIVLVKYKTATTAANSNRTIRSIVCRFFFNVAGFNLFDIELQSSDIEILRRVTFVTLVNL